MNDRTLDLLAAADPARDVPVPPGDVEALLRRAAHDVTTYEVRVPDRRRRALVAVAVGVAVAAVASAAVAVLTRPAADPAAPPAPATKAPATTVPATPSAASAGCLDQIAGDMGAAPHDTAKGAYEYLRTSSLSGRTVQMKDGGFARASYRVETSTWTAGDGSQRRTAMVVQLAFPDETSEAYFRANPGQLPKAVSRAEDVPADQVSRASVPAADPLAMAAALYQPRENGPSQALVGAGDLVRARVLDAEHRAALLRFLARTDGVTCAGTMTDPIGRTGVAVTAPQGAGPLPSPGDHPAQVLVVDPATGEILAAGTTDTGGVTWQDVYQERGFMDTWPATTR
ncbi:CU044_5270 family protein [Dactylosporangium sp. CA-152071]|uniref:CU044_5270 family protein n=1 Tax=Dactylosporangium sp. CA-152071 TaxID=3239933 RepID=UPI003D8F95B8